VGDGSHPCIPLRRQPPQPTAAHPTDNQPTRCQDQLADDFSFTAPFIGPLGKKVGCKSSLGFPQDTSVAFIPPCLAPLYPAHTGATATRQAFFETMEGLNLDSAFPDLQPRIYDVRSAELPVHLLPVLLSPAAVYICVCWLREVNSPLS
jgi:hypothetical protein